MARLYQYQTRAEPLPEIVQIGAWAAQPQTPIRKVLGIAALAASLFFVSVPVPPVESYQLQTPSPVRLVPRVPSFAFAFDPTFEFAAETITLDKWFRELERPRFQLARNQRLYLPFERNVDTPIEDFDWHPESNRPPNRIKLRDYAHKPLARDSAQPVLPMDSWFRETAQPVLVGFKLRESAWALWSPNTPLEDFDWHSDTERPRFEISPRRHAYPSAIADPTELLVNLDKWSQAQTFRPVLIVRPQGGNFLVEVITAAETITLDKWLAALPEPIRKIFPSAGIGVQPQLIFTPALDFTWAHRQPEMARPKIRLTESGLFVVDATEIVTFDKWWREASVPVFKQRDDRYGYVFLFWNTETPAAITITVDMWWQPASEPVRRVKRAAFFDPLATDPTQLAINLDRYFQQASEPLRIKRRAAFFEPTFADLSQLTTGLDRYFVQASEPVRTIARTAWFEAFAIDASQLTQAERITLDKWFREIIGPRFDRARLQHEFPALSRDARLITTVGAPYIESLITQIKDLSERSPGARDLLARLTQARDLTQRESGKKGFRR